MMTTISAGRFPALAGAALLLGASTAQAQVGGHSGIHDPSRIINEDGSYYVFATGQGVSRKSSRNLDDWFDRSRVFPSTPAWVASEVPANDGTFWAPSVLEYQGEYRLYYSVSSFGSQDSAIGLATNVTLDDRDAGYQWIDQGIVIDSEPGASYNAIDPSVHHDQVTGKMWMTFGSFWNGIYVTELDPATGKPASSTPQFAHVARNTASSNNAIEAPYLHQRDGYYYLFVNWGACCSGVNSTYEIRVGRGASPSGPFYGRSRADPTMRFGGGELFLATEGQFIGPGHMSIYSEGGTDYFGYHYYDATSNGYPRYNIETLAWTLDGWPIPASDVVAGDFNGDLAVTAADLQTWRKHYGDTAAADHFLTWQRAYVDDGSTPALLVAEPATAPAAIALTFIAARASRRRRKNLTSQESSRRSLALVPVPSP